MGHRPVLAIGHALRLIGLLLLAKAAWAADYAVLAQGQPSGHLKVAAGANGRLEVDYSFRDNGRGPDIRESFTLDPRGMPVAYASEGKSTFGAVIRETYTLADGRARWKSPADEGDVPAGEAFAFLPLEGTLAYQAAVIRWLLSRPDGAAPTILGQMLRAERIERARVGEGSGAVDLVLVALTGATAHPWFFWFRDDPALTFFSFGWPGFAVIEAGHEALAVGLVERMVAASDRRLQALGRRLARPIPGATLIRSVRWFDAPAAVMRGPSDVWLFDGRIGAVTAPGALQAKPDRTIDGSGRTLLPGLWDMHAHMWAGECLVHLAAGVTHVRDPANQNDHLLRLIGQVDRSELECPGIVPMGFIEGASPFAARNGFVVDRLEAGLDAVDWYAARGFRSIKLYNSIRPEWVKPLAARAHGHGLRVAGHVPAFMRAEQAVRDGYDEITHINQAMLNFVVRPGDDTRTLTRFERIGADAHRVSVQSASARAFLKLLRARNTTVDPTAVAFEAMFTQTQGQPDPSLAAVADQLPVLMQRGIRSASMDLSGARLTTFRASYRRLLDLIGAMHRSGITLVPGTDGTSGIGLHRELELYVQAGITAPEVLRIATWNAARVAGEADRRGRVARGMAADLVLLEGDPSTNISDIRRAGLVIRGTQAFRPAEVYEALGFRPAVPGITWKE